MQATANTIIATITQNAIPIAPPPSSRVFLLTGDPLIIAPNRSAADLKRVALMVRKESDAPAGPQFKLKNEDGPENDSMECPSRSGMACEARLHGRSRGFA